MMNKTDEKLSYDFEAKLDPKGFYPSIRVRESGNFDLGPSPR
jgi:hypothetical protein